MWSDLAYAVAGLGIAAAVLGYLMPDRSRYALAVFGVLALPLGLPVLYDAYRRHLTVQNSAPVTGG